MDYVEYILGVSLDFLHRTSSNNPILTLRGGSEERWKSEGIQVGGVNSGRGVFGHWFDKYDVSTLLTIYSDDTNTSRHLSDEGPAGPTAFWKVSDDIPQSREPHEHEIDSDDMDDPDFDDDFEENQVIIHLPGHMVLISDVEEEVEQ